MYDDKRTILDNGTLSQKQPTYRPGMISMKLGNPANKPAPDHINIDKDRALADYRYEQQLAIGQQQFQQSQQQSQQQFQQQQQASADQGKIICKRYHQLGILSDELNELDQAYGAWLMRTNPKWQKSYWRYARHIVKHLHRERWQNRLLLAALTPLVKVWAQEMGHRMGGNYRHSALGSVLMWAMVRFFMTLGDIRNARLRIGRSINNKMNAVMRKLGIFSQC